MNNGDILELFQSEETYEEGCGIVYTGDVNALEEAVLDGYTYKGEEDLYLDKNTGTLYSLENYMNRRQNNG